MKKELKRIRGLAEELIQTADLHQECLTDSYVSARATEIYDIIRELEKDG